MSAINSGNAKTNFIVKSSQSDSELVQFEVRPLFYFVFCHRPMKTPTCDILAATTGAFLHIATIDVVLAEHRRTVMARAY